MYFLLDIVTEGFFIAYKDYIQSKVFFNDNQLNFTKAKWSE